MNLLPVTGESLERGAEIIKNGGLVAFPTETVYGLGADAFNPQALAKIFDVKKRPHFDPLIIHIASPRAMEDAADFSLISNETRRKLFLLTDNLWPGPLSVVLPKNKKIPGIVTAGLQTVAIRLPSNETALKLISLSGTVIAAPSANPFGSLSPTRAEHVRDGLGDKIDLILDGGACQIGIESTVLDLTSEKIKILRPGGTPKEEIEKLIGKVESENGNRESDSDDQAFSSPGQLKSHYAPKTPLVLFNREEIINQPDSARCAGRDRTALLFFDGSTRDEWQKTDKPLKIAIIKVLSENGDPLEAASRLFEILHEIDNSNISQIIAQLAPQQGLGEAINDRLMRGSVCK